VGWRYGSRVIRSHSLEFQVRWPCAIYFRLPLHSLCLSLPLEVAPLNTVRGFGDRCKLQAVSSPAGSEAEPRRKSNFVHFSLKIWHLVASNLLFFLKPVNHSVSKVRLNFFLGGLATIWGPATLGGYPRLGGPVPPGPSVEHLLSVTTSAQKQNSHFLASTISIYKYNN